MEKFIRSKYSIAEEKFRLKGARAQVDTIIFEDQNGSWSLRNILEGNIKKNCEEGESQGKLKKIRF